MSDDIHRMPVAFPDLYESHSRLADAKVPMGATVTHIYRAKRWRSVDERMGDGYSRRARQRKRIARRKPFVFVPNVIEHKTKSGEGYVPPSHKGYSA